MVGSVSNHALLVVTPWCCSCCGGGTGLVADCPKTEDQGDWGNSSLTSLVAALFCCVEHASVLCMAVDLGKGEEGHLQFARIAWTVPTELGLLVGDVYCVRVELSPGAIPLCD